MIRFLILFILCLSSFVYGAKDPIKIGMSVALTGASQNLGQAMYRSSKVYFDYVNKKGGVHGHQIELIAYDDYYEPVATVRNTIALVEKDKVDLLYGFVGTPTTSRMLPLLKHYDPLGILLFFPFSGAEPQRSEPYNEYVFNLRASYLHETKDIVDHFIRIGRKRIAVFYQSDSYGRTGWSGVKQGLTEHNETIVSDAAYRRGRSYKYPFKQHVKRILEGKPDAIVSIGSYQASAGFIRDLRNAGSTVPVANISFVGAKSLLELLNKESESSDIDYSQNLINSMVVPYNDSSLPAMKEFSELIWTDKTQEFSSTEFEAYLNAKLLVTILNRTREPFTHARLLKAADSVKNLNIGLDQRVTYTHENHQGIDDVFFITVENKEYVSLEEDGWKKWQL